MRQKIDLIKFICAMSDQALPFNRVIPIAHRFSEAELGRILAWYARREFEHTMTESEAS